MNRPAVFCSPWPEWAWLTALTLLLAWLAEWRGAGVALAPLALAGAWLKGAVVIERYMALQRAPSWLRCLVHGWLLLVCGGLAASFL